ncbi:MAG: sialidase family protein [Myxococcota bacterium]
MTRLVLLCSLVGGLAACPAPETELVSNDLKIDEADSQADPDSEGTQMCVNSEGHVFVIWMDNRSNLNGDLRDLWFNRSLQRGEEGTWLPSPIKVNLGDPNKPGPGQVYNPRITCNDTGVFVVWEDDRDGFLENHQIYFNRSLDGGETWLPEDLQIDQMDPGGGSMSLLPEIKAVGQNLHVVWYDGFNGPFDIYYALSSDAGTSFNSPQSLDITRGFAFSSNPRVDASIDGQNVWVVWEESRDGKSDIYINRSRNGGVTFNGAQRLDRGDENGQTNSFAPEICSDGTQFVYVVWHDERDSNENRDIYYNFSDDAGASWFATSRRLDDGDAEGFSNSLFPTCVSEGAVAHVVWQDYRSTNAFDIWYREISNGNPQPEEERVDLGEPNFAEVEGFANSVDAQVALANGTVGVAWMDFRQEASTGSDRGFGDIRYNFKEAGGLFQENDFRVDSWDAGGSFKRDVNFQMLGGELYAAWTDGRNGTFDIFFTRLTIGEEGEPPVRGDN